jgi:uncharacterized phiE125 gp8 family phage protein
MRGHYKITTAPTTEPVTLAEARKQLNFTADDPTDDDTYIEALIGVARQYCEEYTNRAFMPQTITQVLPCFPAGDMYRNPHAAIRLFKSPFASLTSITYRDADDAAQTLDVSGNDADVIVVSTAEPATVSPWIANMPDGWPETDPDRPDAVTVVYQAGYANAAAVPKVFKQAILIIVADLYENRQDRVKQLPTTAENLLTIGGLVREY